MKNTLENILGSDGAVFWAFGIAIATGLGFVYSAQAIDRYFKVQDCAQSRIERGQDFKAAHNECLALFADN
jgi:hypothetical protein